MNEEFRHPPPSDKNLKIDRTDLLLVAFELHRFLDGFGIIKPSLRQKVPDTAMQTNTKMAV
jgi:hypothetical protein